MSTKYVGLDVHQASTSYCVHGSDGRELQSGVLRTKREALLDFVGGLRGEVHIALEEGTQANWLYGMLHPRVKRVVVCDPGKCKAMLDESKSDRVDAQRLATWLRADLLSPVFHRDFGVRILKERVRAYDCVEQDCVRVKNRIKAIFRGQGISCGGVGIYGPKNRGPWLEQLTEPGSRARAELLFRQLDAQEVLCAEARQDVLAEVKKHEARKILVTVPGIWLLRSATLIATVVTPHRFQNKRQFWKYCGLSVVSVGTAFFDEVDGELVRSRRGPKTRGLIRKHNHHLKRVFKSAVIQAMQREEFIEYAGRLEARGLSREIVRVNVARKLASITLTVWKKGVPYDPEKMRAS